MIDELDFFSKRNACLCLVPLSSSLKSKRHQIKSDPTPFGFEGTTGTAWHAAC